MGLMSRMVFLHKKGCIDASFSLKFELLLCSHKNWGVHAQYPSDMTVDEAAFDINTHIMI